MNPTPYDENGNRYTVLDRALKFFKDNPDEVLTRDDITVKFSCSYETARSVARRLIQEGIPRSRLPRVPGRTYPKKPALPFPENLRTSERKAIEAYAAHGTIRLAAIATGAAYHTIETYLKVARRKAGVNSSDLLAARYSAVARQGAQA